MKRSIFLNGRSVEYEFTVKKVKNINLRVRRDGTVSVSASGSVSTRTVERFLLSKADFILSALDRFSRLEPSVLSLEDGDTLLILGAPHVIRNEEGRAASAAAAKDGCVVVFTPDGSLASRKKAIVKLYGDICKNEIYPMCEEAFADFSHALTEMPDISFRKAKSRWGSCHIQKNAIYLNKLLAAVPRECVKYVIYHELTHLICPNHSKEFYRELEKRLPQHRELKKKLGEYSSITEI